jgi:cobalt/nickel transport system permease protein
VKRLADSHTNQISIPEWLLENKAATQIKHHRHSAGFLKKTLKQLAFVFENDFYCDKYARADGFLQRIDARVKLLTLLFFMLFCAFTTNVFVIILLATTAIVYAKLSSLSLPVFIRRIWLYIPLLIFIISLPAATSFFIKGTPLFYIYKDVYISSNGLIAALKLFLRAGVSLSFGYLLIITTRWQSLMSALATLHIPKIFVTIISMAYRYIFLLSLAAEDMMNARLLRTVGKLSTRENRRFFGHGIAFLFLKSSSLSDEIYDAMCCRGYTGETINNERFKLTGIDILFIINNIIVILILFLGELLF